MLERRLQWLRDTYPDLPRKAVDYFYPDLNAISVEEYRSRTMETFCDTIRIRIDETTSKSPPPEILHLVLDNLVKGGLLMVSDPGFPPLWYTAKYVTFAQPDQIKTFRMLANFVGYGFPAIIDAYSSSVLQIIPSNNGRQESGTGFAIGPNLLVTAAHCVSSAPEIAIVGFEKADLAGSRIFLATNQNIDCACILLAKPLLEGRFFAQWDDSRVLDEVVLVGYPSIPTLTGAQVTEKATVSTVIKGGVAGNVSDIFRTDLLLISSPARGGFSGGPVITKIGGVAGMTLRAPFAPDNSPEAQRYDSAGYSFAIPSDTIREFVGALIAGNTSLYEERDPSTFEWEQAS